MTKWSLVILFCTAATLMASVSHAGERALHVSGVILKGVVEENRAGPVSEIFLSFLMEYSEAVNYQVRPLVRGYRLFETGHADCLFPGSIKSLTDNGLRFDPLTVRESTLFYAYKGFAVAKSGKQNPVRLADLEGASIAHVRGINLPDYLTGLNARWISVPTVENKFRMLELGRADYMVLWDPDDVLSLQDLKQAVPPYNDALLLYQGADGLVCRKSPETDVLIEAFNGFMINKEWPDKPGWLAVPGDAAQR